MDSKTPATRPALNAGDSVWDNYAAAFAAMRAADADTTPTYAYAEAA